MTLGARQQLGRMAGLMSSNTVPMYSPYMGGSTLQPELPCLQSGLPETSIWVLGYIGLAQHFRPNCPANKFYLGTSLLYCHLSLYPLHPLPPKPSFFLSAGSLSVSCWAAGS